MLVPIAALSLLCAATASSARASDLSPTAPCSAALSDAVTYEVDFRAVVTPPHHTEVLRVWLPIPPSDGTQAVAESSFETWPMDVEPRIESEPVFGNRFAYFEFDHPKGAQMIRHSFRITTHELRWDLDPARVQNVTDWPASFQPYLRGEEQAVVLSAAVVEKAREIVPAPGNAAADLSSVIDWIEGNLTYDHSNASLRASSEWALERQAGHCSDYHGLCAALGRALGYPTRVTYGINAFPKDSPSHCKAEVFLPPYGWVSFDLSETQKLVRSIEEDTSLAPERQAELVAAALARLRSGFRDNTWFVQTRGSDYELAPPASRRVAVVRTIYAEADGEPLPEPDPGDKNRREFAWMTLHEYVPSRPVSYPFQDRASLEAWIGRAQEER